MHAGVEHNAFESMICIKGRTHGDLIKLVEHSGDLKPDDQQLVPTQQAFVAIEEDQAFCICFKFSKRSPDKHDFLIVIKLDGQQVYRAHIKNGGHRLQMLDRIFTYTISQADGSIQANALKVVEMEEDYATRRNFDAGKIELKSIVARFTIVWRGRAWWSISRPRRCFPSFRARPALGDILEEDVDPSDAAIKKSFTQLLRDRGQPWFKQVYKYRMLVDLTREDRLTSDPNANVVMSVRPTKRRKTAPKRSAAAEDVLANKVAALEAKCGTLERTVQNLQTRVNLLSPSVQPTNAGPSSGVAWTSPPLTPAEDLRRRLHDAHARDARTQAGSSTAAGPSAMLWRPGTRYS